MFTYLDSRKTNMAWLPLADKDLNLSLQTATSVSESASQLLALPQYSYPKERFSGKGIICCAGGQKYLLNAYVLVRMLSSFGLNLPLQIWHLGQKELVEPYVSELKKLGAVFVDAHKILEEKPHHNLNGWELKPYAIAWCDFEEVILLDADNVPQRSPEEIFSWSEYLATGSVFWPDRGLMATKSRAWRLFGNIAPRREREFETGQLAINKERSWHPLLLTNWYNLHSRFFYKHVHGDKETFHLAWRKTDTAYAMPETPPIDTGSALLQHDFAGKQLFHHRANHAKWRFKNNVEVPGFSPREECLAYLEDLKKLVFPWKRMSENERILASTLVGKRFLYTRIGHDSRPMVLSDDGAVGEGAARCESLWWIEEDQLVISSDDLTVTFRAEKRADNLWEGRWIDYEKMPVELRLLDTTSSTGA